MPSDLYLKMDNVKGESQADGMSDNIELESYSFGASSPSDIGNKGLSAGKPSLSDFSFSYSMDASTYQILKCLYMGTPIGTVVFQARKQGNAAKPVTYLKITMTNCFVTGAHQGGGSNGIPNLSCSLSYEQILYEYFTQDSSSGAVSSAGTATYNVAQVKQS